MRKASPAINELATLRTPLEPGEWKVLKLLDELLPDGWEIYTQPHLNGCRPDFVLLDPQVGIVVIEVKDWNLAAYERRPGINHAFFLRIHGDPKPTRVMNPVTQTMRYKREIFELYCPRLSTSSGLAAITAVTIFPNARDQELEALFAIERRTDYELVISRDTLDKRDISQIIPTTKHTSSKLMSAILADDLRSWLVEPDHSAEQRAFPVFDASQREMIENRTESGYRRLRGPAGSGKSLVIAARAARLSSQGKAVLVVTYNITLLNYLRDLCSAIDGRRKNAITWLNFHNWCKRVALSEGLEKEYKAAWRLHHEDEGNAFEEIPDLLLRTVDTDRAAEGDAFDAILVDEGQDFQPSWWQLLRKYCRPGGEMLLVADATQDIYGNVSKWTDEAMTGAGFRGPWSQLTESYRLPNSLVPIVSRFTEKFLSRLGGRQTPTAPKSQGELDFSPCALKWIQVDSDNAATCCLQELLRLIEADDAASRSMTDLTFLTDQTTVGKKVDAQLEQRKIKTTTTFAKADEDERRKKLYFFKGASRVKITTLHSYKGWEGKLLVIYISKAFSLRDYSLIYTGLTRLKRHAEGSCLTVVSSAPNLMEFGREWSDYEDRRNPAESNRSKD